MSPVVVADSGKNVKIFVLDTNVLMHDPTALFKFQEHHVYLPMTVLEELDNAKLGVSEVARNVRQTNRFIDELLTAQKQVVIEEGLQLNQFSAAEEPFKCSGRLYFQTQAHGSNLPESLPGNKNDNSILNTIISLREEVGDHQIVLISKDINLRIKSAIIWGVISFAGRAIISGAHLMISLLKTRSTSNTEAASLLRRWSK